MSDRKEKLLLLLKINRRKEEEAKEQFLKNKKIIEHKKERIVLLKAHKLRMRDESVSITIPALLDNLMRFLKRMDTAIEDENRRIALLEDQQKMHYRTYVAFSNKVKTLEKIIQQFEEQVSLDDQRSTQKKMDELAQKKMLYDDFDSMK